MDEHEGSSGVSYASADLRFGGYDNENNGLGQGEHIVDVPRQRPTYIRQYITRVAEPNVAPVFVGSGHENKDDHVSFSINSNI